MPYGKYLLHTEGHPASRVTRYSLWRRANARNVSF